MPAVAMRPRAAPDRTPPGRRSDTREQLLEAAARCLPTRLRRGLGAHDCGRGRRELVARGLLLPRQGATARGIYRRHCLTLNRERLRLLGEARREGLHSIRLEAFVRPALAEIRGPDRLSFHGCAPRSRPKTPRC